jgi:murein DD-endopeptidase MepM/ murein hydrolase activator NlpD
LVTQSRQSAVALTVLGLLVLWALVLGPARARLPAPVLPPVPESLLPPPDAPSPLRDDISTVTARPGDSLMSVLQRAGLAPAAAQNATAALAGKWDPRGLKIGQEIAVTRDQDGNKELRLSPDLQRDLVMSRGANGVFTAALLPRDILAVPLRVAGTIGSSFFAAAAKAGLPQAALAEMIRAFSYDVDFQREVQPGDRFEVLFDQLIDARSGKIVGNGEIAYAALTLSGKLLPLYRFTPPGGLAGFYSSDGASVKKALLRTPVDGARISSAFGLRKHPILGFTRMHQGVDFAVPAGTPILASGDAVVASAGWSNG